MKALTCILIVVFPLAISCKEAVSSNSIENWKSEIVETEHAFAGMAAKEGIPAAFVSYAAEDVAILRNDTLFTGKESLLKFYSKPRYNSDNVQVSWEPDFVDVSSSGDLGYTYGKYTYTVTDSSGNSKSYKGIFHTVWKRQPDGKWKFVWD